MDTLKRGFSTIEMMIAMALMVVVLSAVVTVSFGNQGFLIGGQTNAEAMNKAQDLLEREQALARKDFNLVNSTSSTDGFYTMSVDVGLVPPSYLSKSATATISWIDEHKVPHSVTLTTLISNFENPTSANTCNSSLTSGDWNSLQIVKTIDFGTIGGSVPAGSYALSDIDAYQGKLYVTAAKTTNTTDPTFFIFDLSNPINPTLTAATDTAPVIYGFNAVRVANGLNAPTTTYAYLANGYSHSYNSCKPGPSCAELQVIDVTAPNSNLTGRSMGNFMIASSSGPAVRGTTAGNALFYKNGYIFLGLTSTGGNGAGFNIIDAHDLPALFAAHANPIMPIGYYNVGSSDINAVTVRGSYVYLAVPSVDPPMSKVVGSQLITLDISTDITNPGLVGGFAGTGSGHGKSLAFVGDNLYLGRTSPNAGYEFHVLDNTSPNTNSLPQLRGAEIGQSVNGVLVRDNLTYLLTNTGLITTNATSSATTTLALPVSGSSYEPSLDCEDNYFYVTANDASDRGRLFVVTAN